MDLNTGMTVEVTVVTAPTAEAALTELRAKLAGTLTQFADSMGALAAIAEAATAGMQGWFEEYPDRPVGSHVLCAACAAVPSKVEDELCRVEEDDGDDYFWDGVERIRPIPLDAGQGVWSPVTTWYCTSCLKPGWERR